MSQPMDQQVASRRFFSVPETWVGWMAIGLLFLSTALIFARQLTGGFRGIFFGWIIAGVFAITAMLWKKERSILVWIPAIVGILAGIWMAAEMAFPH